MEIGGIFIHIKDSESEITLLRDYRAEHLWPKNAKSQKLKNTNMLSNFCSETGCCLHDRKETRLGFLGWHYI